MKLTVITHTSGKRPDLLARCVQSVERALPEGAEHRIIHTNTYEQWVRSRLEAVLESEVACYVDDDDEIHPEALRECLPLMRPDLGIVCTNEVSRFVNGTEIVSSNTKTYTGVSLSPREVHHLCLINSKFVAPDIRTILDTNELVGVDWLVKASATLSGGGIHVPMPGYYWTMHSPDSNIVRTRMRYLDRIPGLQEHIANWGYVQKGIIPRVYTPSCPR